MENVTGIIGENIAALRRVNNLTQQQLADKIGYSNKAVSRWENGECLPSVETLCEICSFFGVEFAYLIEKHEQAAKIKNTLDGNKLAIALLTCLTIISFAVILFVYIKVVNDVYFWQVFVCAIPLCAASLYILARKWKWGKITKITLASIFLWSLITTVYVIALKYNLWLIYLVGAPLQVIILLAFYVGKSERHK